MPLEKSGKYTKMMIDQQFNLGNPTGIAKSKKIWLRLKLALDDIQSLIAKYDLRNKFIH
jgi:hypothetical protein